MLPQHTFPGNVVLSSRATSGLSPPVLPDAELEKLCLGHMASAAKDALNALGDVPSSAAEESRPSHADASDGSASDHMSGESQQSIRIDGAVCSRCAMRQLFASQVEMSLMSYLHLQWARHQMQGGAH